MGRTSLIGLSGLMVSVSILLVSDLRFSCVLPLFWVFWLFLVNTSQTT